MGNCAGIGGGVLLLLLEVGLLAYFDFDWPTKGILGFGNLMKLAYVYGKFFDIPGNMMS